MFKKSIKIINIIFFSPCLFMAVTILEGSAAILIINDTMCVFELDQGVAIMIIKVFPI